MSKRRELISNALKARFNELCGERIPRLEIAASEPENFLLRVQHQLSGASLADVRKLILYPRGLDYWTTSDIGCRRSLLALSLGKPLDLRPAERSPVEPFIELLNASRADAERRVRLLEERYSSPLSFTLPGEDALRELILTRLMALIRARIEKDAALPGNPEEVLLMLNLVAVHAVRVPDLRFLDALNYYYELLPTVRSPTEQYDALLASYQALYAQALAAWM